MLKKHQNQISIVDFENVLSTEIILRATIQNKFSKSPNFQDKNLLWNSALVKLFFFFFLQFTVILLMILKHISYQGCTSLILWTFFIILWHQWFTCDSSLFSVISVHIALIKVLPNLMYFKDTHRKNKPAKKIQGFGKVWMWAFR